MQRPAWLNLIIPYCAIVGSVGIAFQASLIFMILTLWGCSWHSDYGLWAVISSQCSILILLCLGGLVLNLLLLLVANKLDKIRPGAIRFALIVFTARLTFSIFKLSIIATDDDSPLSYVMNFSVLISILFDLVVVMMMIGADKSLFHDTSPSEVGDTR